jgi:hypothetical protein
MKRSIEKELMMKTYFVKIEVDLEKNPTDTKNKIEYQLAQQGKALRWAITKIDTETQIAEIEAIVTR